MDVIVERTSRAKLDALSLDRSAEMLRMWEKLASMDVESRQAMATSWLSLQAMSDYVRVFVLGAPCEPWCLDALFFKL